jgi:UDP-N-acetyl-D-galactosamine dehydrogenase
MSSVADPAQIAENKYDVIVLAVAHKEFLAMDISQFKKTQSIVFDIKSALPREIVDARL